MSAGTAIALLAGTILGACLVAALNAIAGGLRTIARTMREANDLKRVHDLHVREGANQRRELERAALEQHRATFKPPAPITTTVEFGHKTTHTLKPVTDLASKRPPEDPAS